MHPRNASTANSSGWKRRLWLSLVYAGLAVIVSTVVVLALASLEKPSTAQQNGTSAIDVAADVLGFPLVTGWVVVSLLFGEWRAIHQGQIALVPFISIAIDALLIFLVWGFFHRKASRDLDSDGVLHING
jgi:hypothetical protein